MVVETTLGAVGFLLGRVLFGGVLAFMGLNHFVQRAEMTGYAASKGLPAPDAAVLASGAVLLLGGLGLVAGAFPVLASSALAGFLLVASVTMHDFWTVGDPEARQQELTHFLKNAALAGGALVLLAVGGAEWPFALGLSVF